MFTNGQYSDHEHWRIVSYTHTHTHTRTRAHSLYMLFSFIGERIARWMECMG